MTGETADIYQGAKGSSHIGDGRRQKVVFLKIFLNIFLHQKRRDSVFTHHPACGS